MLEMKILGPHSRSTNQKLEVGPSNLLLKAFWVILTPVQIREPVFPLNPPVMFKGMFLSVPTQVKS